MSIFEIEKRASTKLLQFKKVREAKRRLKHQKKSIVKTPSDANNTLIG
jgi:hypothetical protein